MGIHEFAEHDPQVEVSQVMGVPPNHHFFGEDFPL